MICRCSGSPYPHVCITDRFTSGAKCREIKAALAKCANRLLVSLLNMQICDVYVAVVVGGGVSLERDCHKICIINNEKNPFCTLGMCVFHYCTFCIRSRSVLQLCGQREHLTTN